MASHNRGHARAHPEDRRAPPAARVAVSSPGDPREVAARQIAAHGVSGATTCAACATGAPCTTCARRRVAPSTLVPAGGAPLDPAIRGRAETTLGAPLDAVRVHTGPEADRAARRLDARAFAYGSSIVFADGAYAPHSALGQALLLHELTHTIQDPAGTMVYRDGPGAGAEGSDAGSDGGGGAGGADSGPGTDAGANDVAGTAPQDTAASDSAPAPTFDPCAVAVGPLSNAELLETYRTAQAYLQRPEHSRRDDYYAYRWLWRQAGRERQRRAEAGEAWLADISVTSVPGNLHRLEPGPHGSVLIVSEAGTAAAGAPRSYSDATVVTSAQLERYLRNNHIERATADQVLTQPDVPHVVDPIVASWIWNLEHPPQPPDPLLFAPGMGGMAGTLGVDRTPSVLASEIHRGFGVGADLGYNSALKYQGAVGEYGFLALPSRPAGPVVDLNVTTGGNAPNHDFLFPEGRVLPQVKTRYGASDAPAVTSAYLGGMESIDLHPSTPYKRTQALASLAALGDANDVYLGAWVAQSGGRLVVNAEDVPGTRAARRQRVLDGGAAHHADLYRSLLWAHDVQLNGARYTVVDFNRDLRAGAVPPQISAAVANLAADQVIAGVPGDIVVRATDLVTSRIGPGVEPIDAARSVTPLEVEGAVRGTSMPRRAAAMGAAGDLIGGGLMIGYQRARAAMTGTAYDRSVGEDLRGFAISTPAAAMTSALELRMTDQALQLAARGMPVPWYMGAGMTRIGLPAITAPLVAMGQMGIDSHSYPWQEYVARGTRAGFSALVASGFVATVGAFAASGAEGGAVAGTVVEPGGGTAVGGGLGFVGGIIVGTVAYAISDFLIGDTVEDVTRSVVGEPEGCPR